jgi:hypothetical protein
MVDAEVHWHVVLVHAHVRWMVTRCQAVAPQLPLYAPFATISLVFGKMLG